MQKGSEDLKNVTYFYLPSSSNVINALLCQLIFTENTLNFAEISRDGDIAEEEVLKPAPVPMTARHQISAELQQTEKNYCDTLSTLIKVSILLHYHTFIYKKH